MYVLQGIVVWKLHDACRILAIRFLSYISNDIYALSPPHSYKLYFIFINLNYIVQILYLLFFFQLFLRIYYYYINIINYL